MRKRVIAAEFLVGSEYHGDAGVGEEGIPSYSAGYLPSRSRIKYFTRQLASSRSMRRLRAVLGNHAELG